jgi:hypothetical protein
LPTREGYDHWVARLGTLSHQALSCWLNSSFRLDNIQPGLGEILCYKTYLHYRHKYTFLPLSSFQHSMILHQHSSNVGVLVLPFHGNPIQFGSCLKVGGSQDLIIHIEDTLHLFQCCWIGIVINTDEPPSVVIPLLGQIVRVLGLEAMGEFP